MAGVWLSFRLEDHEIETLSGIAGTFYDGQVRKFFVRCIAEELVDVGVLESPHAAFKIVGEVKDEDAFIVGCDQVFHLEQTLLARLKKKAVRTFRCEPSLLTHYITVAVANTEDVISPFSVVWKTAEGSINDQRAISIKINETLNDGFTALVERAGLGKTDIAKDIIATAVQKWSWDESLDPLTYRPNVCPRISTIPAGSPLDDILLSLVRSRENLSRYAETHDFDPSIIQMHKTGRRLAKHLQTLTNKHTEAV